jgi:hypothetical protein
MSGAARTHGAAQYGRGRRRRAGAWLVALVVAAPSAANVAHAEVAAPTVTARIDRADVDLGDPISLTITAIHRAEVAVTVAAAPDLSPFSLLDRADTEMALGDGRLRKVTHFRLAAYQLGDLTIPSVEVNYLTPTGELRSQKTPALAVRVRSVLPEGDDAAPREIVAPVPVFVRDFLPFYLVFGFGAVVVGAAVGSSWWRRRARRHRQAAPALPKRPPHELALERLVAIRRAGNFELGEYKPFYFSVSEIVREYLGARYGFESLELTTTELVAALEPRVGTELSWVQLQSWLSATDLVKFARVRPSADEALDVLETAFRLVQSTAVAAAPAPTNIVESTGGGGVPQGPEAAPEPPVDPAAGVS